MSPYQLRQLTGVLERLLVEPVEGDSEELFPEFVPAAQPTLHHGDCIGADAQAHDAARALGYHIVLHPPTNPSRRAYCSADEEAPPLEYLARNKRIVESSELLIAGPSGPERVRSGTWSTVRYARSLHLSVIILQWES